MVDPIFDIDARHMGVFALFYAYRSGKSVCGNLTFIESSNPMIKLYTLLYAT